MFIFSSCFDDMQTYKDGLVPEYVEKETNLIQTEREYSFY